MLVDELIKIAGEAAHASYVRVQLKGKSYGELARQTALENGATDQQVDAAVEQARPKMEKILEVLHEESSK